MGLCPCHVVLGLGGSAWRLEGWNAGALVGEVNKKAADIFLAAFLILHSMINA